MFQSTTAHKGAFNLACVTKPKPVPLDRGEGDDKQKFSEVFQGPDIFIPSVLRSIKSIRAITIAISVTILLIVSFAVYVLVDRAEGFAYRSRFTAIADHVKFVFLSDVSAKLWACRAISSSITTLTATSQSRVQLASDLLQRLLPEALPGLEDSKVTWSALETLGSSKQETSSPAAVPGLDCRMEVGGPEAFDGIGTFDNDTNNTTQGTCDIEHAEGNGSVFHKSGSLYVEQGVWRQQTLKELLRSKVPILSKMIDSSDDHKGEPHFTLFAPVLHPDRDGDLIGSVAINFKWSKMVHEVLPPEVEGTVLTILSSCSQTLSFEVKGARLAYIGQGEARSSLVYSETTFDNFESLLQRSFGVAHQTRGRSGCLYRIRVYPSEILEHSFSFCSPLLATAAVVLIFAIVFAVFGVSDFLIRRDHNAILDRLKRSNELISSIFPENVRSRVLGDGLGHPKSPRKATSMPKKTAVGESSRQHLQRMLSIQQDIAKLDIEHESEPIADFFPEATVIFADIVGFTAWSSERDPTQVFRLLETLFGIFDKIAHKLGVFKVETVGDCYVAVAGLPESMENHAVIMSWFAYECMVHMRELTKTLELSMGPSTGDLRLRIGLHSGPLTAGVLRAAKSRFQLFGDTVNTASRMESTSRANMIQVSETTANLLIAAGKANWIKCREDLVPVKGKGEMKTYWVNPIRGLTARTQSPSFSSMRNLGDCARDTRRLSQRSFSWGLRCNTSLDNIISKKSCSDLLTSKPVSEKRERLVDWNTASLLSLLQNVVARRATKTFDAKKRSSTVLYRLDDGMQTPWQQRAETIQMPNFDRKVITLSPDCVSTELSPAIRAQLRSYVDAIASLYNEHSFHNFEHASHVALSASKLMKRIITPDDVDCNSIEALAHAIHERTLGISSDALMQFAVVFSAVIHDVEHQGVPNSQLVKESSPLSSKYHGKSVAEQNSIQVAWDLLMEDRFTELRSCIYTNEDERQRFWQLLVNAVIATDIEDRELCCERKGRWDKAFKRDSPQLDDIVDRQATIVFEYIIQASDVAHTMQHWYIYRKWNDRLFEERFAAYRDGRAQEDPSVNWYANEINFFDSYVIPLAKTLKECGVFGVSGDEYLNYAQENRREWEVKGRDITRGLASMYQLDNGASSTATPGLDDSWGLFVGTDDEIDFVPLTSPVA